MSNRPNLFVCLFVLPCALAAGETKPNTETPSVTPPVVTNPATPNGDPKPAVNTAGRDWPGIFRNVQSADVAVRDAAVTDFLAAIDPSAQKTKKPYYAKFKLDFGSKDIKVHDEAGKRVALIAQVVALNDKRYKPMMNGLTSTDPKLQSEQLDFLFKSLEDSLANDHIRELIEQLGAENADASKKAFDELKTFGGEAADELANGLDDEKVQVKKMCAELLKEMGAAAKEAVNSLIFKLKDTEDKLGRKYAAQILENLGPDGVEAVDDLVLSLDDEDDKPLRRICANILKKMGTAYKDATPELIVYLTHDDKSVRGMASELLLGLGKEAKVGVRELIEVIDEPPLPPAPNAQAQPVPPVPANPQAAAAAAGNDTDSKIRAAKILANIGPDAKEALAGLKKYLNDKDPDLQAAVKLAVDKITEGKPIDTLIPPPSKTPPKTAADKITDPQKGTNERF